MPGTPQVWLEEFIVNLTTTGNQDDPDIIQLANGNILVAWTSDDDSGAGATAGPDIIGQIFDPMGNRIGVEFRINDGSFFSDNENNVDLVALPNGGFVAVYQDVDAATSLRLIQYGSDGNVVSTQFAQQNIVDDVNAAAPSHRNPQIAVSSSTQAIIVYEKTDGAATSLMMQTYNPTAQTFGAETLIMFDTVAPAVATLSNGDIVVVGTRPTSGDNSIVMRILNPDGTSQLGFTDVAGTKGDGFNDFDPAVAALAGGGYVVVYTDIDATDTDTSFQIFDNSGVLVTSANNVQGGTNNDNEAVVAGLSDGTFVIAYDDDIDDQIEVAHYSATGGFLGSMTVSGPGSEMAIRDLGDGRFAVTWESLAAGGEIRMEILDTRDFVNAAAVYEPEPNWQVGTIFDDVFTTDDDADIVHGHGGGDTITQNTGSGAPNQYFGDEGNDTLIVSTFIDSDSWNGGAGSDTISLAGTSESGVVVDLAAGTLAAIGATETAVGFEHATGSAQADTLRGSDIGNILIGGGGADWLTGRLGADTLTGGADADRFDFNTTAEIGNAAGSRDVITDFVVGTDKIDLDGIDALTTVAGVQHFTWLGTAGHTGAGATLRFQQVGGNTLIYGDVNADGSGDFTLQLNGLHNLTAADFTNASITTIQGTAAGEILNGAPGGKVMIGLGGNDTLIGNTGGDTLRGGLGADTLTGGAGSDRYDFNTVAEIGNALNARDVISDFQQGVDLIDLGDVDANAALAGVQHFAWLGGAPHTGAGATLRFGQAGGNTLVFGDTNADGAADFTIQLNGLYSLTAADFTVASISAIVGTAGNDTLTGMPGGKLMAGFEGNDTITGGAGADTLQGGIGVDRLTGSAGFDSFDFNAVSHIGNAAGSRDIITDFQVGIDKIDLADIDASTLVAGNQAFAFIGTAAHTGAGATVRFTQTGGNTLVSGDVNADGANDFTIQLTGLHTLTVADFVL